MKRQILAGAAALVLASGMTTGAIAFDHNEVGHVGLRGGVHGPDGIHGSRFAGIRGYDSWRHGGWGSRRFVGSYGGYGDWGNGPYYRGGHYTDLGPLGFTWGPVTSYGYCDPHYCIPGSSIAAWSW
jgi:hypothetical protein